MGNVVQLNEPASATERERMRFEAFVRLALRHDEGDAVLRRSRGGDYVLAATRAGWASWQAALFDLIERYKADLGK